MAQNIITIFGGSGQLGRLVARRFAKLGWQVRVAVRRPNEALFVRSYGTVGQVEPIQVNIRDEATIARVIEGSDIVVNCIGILYEDKFQNFEEIHQEAANDIARISAKAGVKHLAHISALGASKDAPSKYAQTKFAGEEAVRKHFPSATILRPSVMFGFEADAFNKFARLVKWLPATPIVRPDAKLQPVYIDDVAAAVEKATLTGKKGVIELGGPEVMNMREIFELVARTTRRKRFFIPMPNLVARITARMMQIIEFLSLGIIKNRLITPDQFLQLGEDNIVMGADGMKALGIKPASIEPKIMPYMIPFRSRGEFEELVKPVI